MNLLCSISCSNAGKCSHNPLGPIFWPTFYSTHKSSWEGVMRAGDIGEHVLVVDEKLQNVHFEHYIHGREGK